MSVGARGTRLLTITEKNSLRWTFIALAATALAVITPFFFLGQASGHDFEFHLASWMDAARQLHEGILFPRWATWANFGYGEPRFIFYPPISWYLGALLSFVLPWRAVPGAFIAIALIIAGLCMHCLARAWMPPGPAFAAAVLYAVNPYNMALVYLRSDFAELLVSALFPLAVYYTIGCANPITDPGKRAEAYARWRAVPALAVVYAAIWLSNAPGAVITSYALAILLVTHAVLRRSVTPLFKGTLALILGLMLAAAYIVPAAREQSWVNIGQVLSSGLRPQENFIFTSILDPEHNFFNLTISTIALLMAGLAGIGATLSYRTAKRTRGAWVPMLVLAATCIVLMFSVSEPLWRHMPEIQFVQFPWRWLFPLGTTLAFFLGEAIAESRRRIAISAALLALFAAVTVWITAGPLWSAWWDSEDVHNIESAIQSGQGYEGTDEYYTRGADQNYLVRPSSPISLIPIPGQTTVSTQPESAAPAAASVQLWDPEHKEFTVQAAHPTRAALHLLNYPAWQVRVNGQPAEAESDVQTGRMFVRVEPGISHIDVRFSRTPDRLAGAALSAFACLIIVGMGIVGWRGASGSRVSDDRQ